MSDKKPLARLRFVIMSILFSLLVGGLAAEIFLRVTDAHSVADVRSRIPYVTRPGYMIYEENASFSLFNERRQEIHIEIDERGLRNARGSFVESKIIILGDSFINAANTAADNTLANQLRARGYSVYNAGVDGAGTFQEYYLLRDHLQDSGRRIVILAFYLGNDFQDNYWATFQEADRAAALPGKIAPPSPSSSKPDGASRICNLSVVCGRLRDMVRIGYVEGRAKDPMGSYALAEMLILRDRDELADIARAKTRAALRAIHDIVAERHGVFVVVGIPSKAQVLRSFREISAFDRDSRASNAAQETFLGGYDWDRPDRDLALMSAEMKVPYVSLLGEFREAARQGSLYYDFDVHWNDRGQRVAADSIASFLKAANLDHGK